MSPVPTLEWTPTTASELTRMIAENFRGEKTPLIPVGGRTSLHAAGPVSSDCAILTTSHLQSIIDYPSRDMTITVEAGIRIETLQQELATQHQRLPIGIPQAGRATLGGAIAANASASTRFGYGTFRDYVIGISAVDGQGRLFSAGGRVVKNVAGYDLCKLLIGSMGTLATITEVTLKLRPMFEMRSIVIAAFSTEKSVEPVLADLNRSETRPVIVDLYSPKAAAHLIGEAQQSLPQGKVLLCLGYEGTEQETNWQVQTVLDELKRHQPDELQTYTHESADQIHNALTEFQTASDDPVTFRASVPSSLSEEFLRLAMKHDVAIQAHAGNGVIYGHIPDRCTDANLATAMITPLRNFAEQHGGALAIVNCDPEWLSQLDLTGKRDERWKLMTGVKQALDPAGLLSPNRML